MGIYYRGATLDVALAITDVGTGVPVDLTGATVKFRLAQSVGTPAVYEADMVLGAETGTATLTIPAATTLTLSGGYVFTVHVTEASGRVFVAAQGGLTFANIVLAGA